MKRQGFTLVELLAVVAIIALLISIIAPSVGLVKEIARLTVCQTTLRISAQAINMYADKNGGYMPPFEPLLPDTSAMYTAVSPYHSVCSIVWKDANTVDYYQGWGMLHKQGYLPDPTNLYCPSRVETEDLNTQIYSRRYWPAVWDSQGMPEPAGTALRRTTASYLLNPLQTNSDEVAVRAGRNPVAPFKFDRLDATRVLAMDLLMAEASSGDPVASSHSRPEPTWNMAFVDSHVEPRAGQDAQKYAIDGDNPQDSWVEFLDAYKRIVKN